MQKTKIIFPQLHTQRWGYNDLERRKGDLCRFIKYGCNFMDAMLLMESIKFMPLPKGSH